jgi:hypothetical protein
MMTVQSISWWLHYDQEISPVNFTNDYPNISQSDFEAEFRAIFGMNEPEPEQENG